MEHRLYLNKTTNFCTLAISLKSLWKAGRGIRDQNWSITSVGQFVQG